MYKYLLLTLTFFVGCGSFEYNNPLDRDSKNFRDDMVGDDDFDGVLNFEEDDNNDGVKNYRDTTSEYCSDYFIEKEDAIIDGKDNTINTNDGTLDIKFKTDEAVKKYAKVNNFMTYTVEYKSSFDIVRVEFDWESDGEFDEFYKTEIPYRSHTFRSAGIKETTIKVADKNGNVKKEKAKCLIYDSDIESEKPFIKLKGDSIVHLEERSDFEDEGFSVEDDIYTDNELAEFVHIDFDEKILFGKKGEYYITYTVYDTEGNKATSTRVVIFE